MPKNTVETTFQIRKIPREVWALVKARATREQRSIQRVLLDFLTAYAGGPAKK